MPTAPSPSLLPTVYSDVCSVCTVPDDNISHLISSVELLVVDTNNWYDAGNLSEELFICLPQVPEVFDSDCGLAVTLPHVDPPQALLWGNIQVDYQIGLLPGRFISRDKRHHNLHLGDHTAQLCPGGLLPSVV